MIQDVVQLRISDGTMKRRVFLQACGSLCLLPSLSMGQTAAETKQQTEQAAYLIFVTNEIGMGGVPMDAVQRKFTDMQGWLNQYIAARADEVVLMVSGIPLKVK